MRDSNEDMSSPSTMYRLTTKIDPFNGAVLTPKHARELTPQLVVSVTVALADTARSLTSPEQMMEHHEHHPSEMEGAFRRLSIGGEDAIKQQNQTPIPYTVWITEAWRVLNWSEPSATLFWEMATMYYTLHVARCHFDEDIMDDIMDEDVLLDGGIPPILSVGSTGSTGSNTPNPANLSGGRGGGGTGAGSGRRQTNTTQAPELPVWLLGTYLLLHCEERVFKRNVAAEDGRRYERPRALDLLRLSPRTRIHADDYGHQQEDCAAYLLRHLRKCLLFCALPHGQEAMEALDTLLEQQGGPTTIMNTEKPGASNEAGSQQSYDHALPMEVSLLVQAHDDEHGDIGATVLLSNDDLTRLSFLFGPPNGGHIDDPSPKIVDCLFPMGPQHGGHGGPIEYYTLYDVERKLMGFLERDLNGGGVVDAKSTDNNANQSIIVDGSRNNANNDASTSIHRHISDDGIPGNDQSKMIDNLYESENFFYQKELSYKNLRQKTILIKPTSANHHHHHHHHHYHCSESMSDHSASGASSGGNAPGHAPYRLHDLVVTDCSDAHMYLLQPFEHVTISACTGCHIVVGAVAGLLHVVDCEHTTVTSASRRILVCNSFETVFCSFTPSPPLLVGDNRSCQFAPYNTYYDGLREDLLATGLAAQVLDNAAAVSSATSVTTTSPPNVRCGSNRWKEPRELAKLELPQQQGTTGGGADHGHHGSHSPTRSSTAAAGDSMDDSIPMPILLPASEFNVLFVPLETERQRRRSAEETTPSSSSLSDESNYCRNLSEMLQLCPFRLPHEYEKRVRVKADRMRSLQQTIQTDLAQDQMIEVEEELNHMFRDWLVKSGNLRQVLDLVHMEKKGVF